MLSSTIKNEATTSNSSRIDVGITLAQRIACGTTGALMTALLVTPLDVVKVRLQSTDATRGPFRCIVCSTGLMDHVYSTSGKPTVPPPWFMRPLQRNGSGLNTWTAMRRIVRTEGVFQLWSGLSPTLVMAIPTTVMYFSMYDLLSERLLANANLAPVAAPVAGAISRVTAVTIVSPIEMLRTKVQSERMSYAELCRLVTHSVRTNGIGSLWLGLSATIMRDAPFSAIYWYTYERLKRDALSRQLLDEPTFGISFACGGLAGALAALVTQPFDVVKTRTQIAIGEQLSKHSLDLPRRCECPTGTVWQSTALLYRQNGLSALYAGVLPRLIKVAPACAIMIGTYEFGKLYFRHRNRELLESCDCD